MPPRSADSKKGGAVVGRAKPEPVARALTPPAAADRTLAALPNVLVQQLCGYLTVSQVLTLRHVNRSLSRCLDGANSGESVYWWERLDLVPDRARNPFRVYLTCHHIRRHAPYAVATPLRAQPSALLLGGEAAPTPMALTGVSLLSEVADDSLFRRSAEAARAHWLWALIDRVPDRGSVGIGERDGGYVLPSESVFRRHTSDYALSARHELPRDVLRFVYAIEDDSWAYAPWEATRKPRRALDGSLLPVRAPQPSTLRKLFTAENLTALVVVILSAALLYAMANTV